MGDHPKTFHPIQAGMNHPVVLCLFRGRGADYKHGFELIQGCPEYQPGTSAPPACSRIIWEKRHQAGSFDQPQGPPPECRLGAKPFRNHYRAKQAIVTNRQLLRQDWKSSPNLYLRDCHKGWYKHRGQVSFPITIT